MPGRGPPGATQQAQNQSSDAAVKQSNAALWYAGQVHLENLAKAKAEEGDWGQILTTAHALSMTGWSKSDVEQFKKKAVFLMMVRVYQP